MAYPSEKNTFILGAEMAQTLFNGESLCPQPMH